MMVAMVVVLLFIVVLQVVSLVQLFVFYRLDMRERERERLNNRKCYPKVISEVMRAMRENSIYLEPMITLYSQLMLPFEWHFFFFFLPHFSLACQLTCELLWHTHTNTNKIELIKSIKHRERKKKRKRIKMHAKAMFVMRPIWHSFDICHNHQHSLDISYWNLFLCPSSCLSTVVSRSWWLWFSV